MFWVRHWVREREKQKGNSDCWRESVRFESPKMVARTPPKQRKILAALNPVLIRETLNKVICILQPLLIFLLNFESFCNSLKVNSCGCLKVDQCMLRLQELQYTVAGGTKVVSGVSLSPRSTRGYLKTSLRCKQESIRYL